MLKRADARQQRNRSAGEFVKHRGTVITEEATADFSVYSVPLCFYFSLCQLSQLILLPVHNFLSRSACCAGT